MESGVRAGCGARRRALSGSTALGPGMRPLRPRKARGPPSPLEVVLQGPSEGGSGSRPCAIQRSPFLSWNQSQCTGGRGDAGRGAAPLGPDPELPKSRDTGGVLGNPSLLVYPRRAPHWGKPGAQRLGHI